MARKSSRFRKGSESEGKYEVGYCRPPVKHRFKKGVSGNPRGRPRTLDNPFKCLVKELQQKISINEDGRSYKISKFEALIKQLVRQAMLGNPRAQKFIVDWFPRIEGELAVSPSENRKAFEAFVAALDRVAEQKIRNAEPDSDK